MKKIIIISILFFLTFSGFSQDITGDWGGKLKVQGIQLRIVFHITEKNGRYGATMDSPDQGAYNLPVDSIRYSGIYNSEKNTITGNFIQTEQTFPLNLTKSEIKEIRKKRYQEPIEPIPYISENINFKNKKAGITLAGTLTLPDKKGKYPAVILISGSGPQNRDEELLGHKPFLIISDYLTRQGIAVLRYDDRGTAKSAGNFKTAVTKDFAEDAEAALYYLLTRKEINKQNIGLIGQVS